MMEQRPDLILMEIQLPIMDGYEATRRIKGRSGSAIDSDYRGHLLCGRTEGAGGGL